MKMWIGTIALFCVLWGSIPCLSQERPPTGDTILERSLDEVMIRATRLPSRQLRAARSIYQRVLSQDNRHNMHLTADEALWYLPGVYAVNPYNFSQDLRISVRGFGARSAFGVRGLKILLDGVPATTPDGQSQLDHFDPQQFAAVEMISGSAGSLYGNASGGVIDFRSQVLDQNTLGGSVTLGSNGLRKYALRAAKVDSSSTVQGSLTYQSFDGYRHHSRGKNAMGNLAWLKKIEEGELNIRLNLTHSPEAQDPGGINLELARMDRKSARDRNVLFDGGEEITRGSLSLGLNKKLGIRDRMSLNGYYVFRDFNNRLPFENGGMVSFFRNYAGVQGQLIRTGRKHQLQLGVDAEWQSDARQRFNNLEGIRGEEVLHQLEQFGLLGFYAQTQIDLSQGFTGELATRVDMIRASVNDRFISNGDQSGHQNFLHLSPSAGLNYAWSNQQHVFVRFGHSFETPSLTELSNNPSGNGGFNPDLQPQIANHYELGAKGKKGSWRYQATLFYIALQNELVPFELADFPGRTFFQNSGKSQRTGLEVSLDGMLGRYLSLMTAHTYSNFRFTEFLTEGGDFAGKKLPGIPNYFSTLGLQTRNLGGLFFGADLNAVGKLFANNDNSVLVENYLVVHLRVGKEWENDRGKLALHLGIRNLAGVEYFDNIRPNAFGQRFYEPAPKQQLFFGLNFDLL